MKDPTYLSVRNTLASYLDVHPSEIRPDQQLERDWGLERAEIQVIAVRLEEYEDVEIRSQDLELVHTVGQLVGLVRALRRREELALEITTIRTRRSTNSRRSRPPRSVEPPSIPLALPPSASKVSG